MTMAVFSLQTAAAKTPVKAAMNDFAGASLSNITLLVLFLFVLDRPENPW
jgi:hypothetical protein